MVKELKKEDYGGLTIELCDGMDIMRWMEEDECEVSEVEEGEE